MHSPLKDSSALEGKAKESFDFNPRMSMPSNILVRAKLEMDEPGDSDEQEADSVANSIVNKGETAKPISSGNSGKGIALPSQFGNQLASLQGQGSHLDGDLKNMMESGFGRNFSSVRLHNDSAAAEMSSSISARAFTFGNDIYFNQGQYNPHTQDGQRLIAHELAHVAQGTNMVHRKKDPNASYEPTTLEEKRAYVRYYSTGKSLKLPKSQLPKKYEEQYDYDSYSKNVDALIDKSKNTIDEASGMNPVTVVIMMSARTDPRVIANSDIIFKSLKNPIFLLEVESVSKCTKLLTYIKESIAPIQNLIILGHGNSNYIKLNPEHYFRTNTEESFERDELGSKTDIESIKNNKKDVSETLEFFKTIGQLMPEDSELKKKIFFYSCLTASHTPGENSSQASFYETALAYTKWKNSNNIIGGKTSLDLYDVSLSIDERSGELNVTDLTNLNLLTNSPFAISLDVWDPNGAFRSIVDDYVNDQNAIALKLKLKAFKYIYRPIKNDEGKAYRDIEDSLDKINKLIDDNNLEPNDKVLKILKQLRNIEFYHLGEVYDKRESLLSTLLSTLIFHLRNSQSLSH